MSESDMPFGYYDCERKNDAPLGSHWVRELSSIKENLDAEDKARSALFLAAMKNGLPFFRSPMITRGYYGDPLDLQDALGTEKMLSGGRQLQLVERSWVTGKPGRLLKATGQDRVSVLGDGIASKVAAMLTRDGSGTTGKPASTEETFNSKWAVFDSVDGVVVARVSFNDGGPGSENDVFLSIASTNEDRMWEVIELFQRLTVERPKLHGQIQMLVCSGNETFWRALPETVSSPLVEENYTPEVIRGYRRVVADLKSPQPHGRISVFDGLPGTGKTYLIRSLIEEVGSAAKFLFVAPEDVKALGSPTVLQLLLRLRGEDPEPLVVLVEDADSIIARRGGDNMSAISAVLNLGDGLLGQALDLRLVLTTNAGRTDLDPAITRPGRLSASVHVGLLSKSQACRRYIDLGGKNVEHDITADTSLAEVYQKATDPDFMGLARSGKMGY